MSNHPEVREFLVSRRAKITPQDAGLATYGTTRRVPGLRRGEVAERAGVSVEYYSRLERGNLAGVSDAVLDALARALRLDEAERAHLVALARSAGAPGRTSTTAATQRMRPSVLRVLELMSDVPAIVNNTHLDLLAANRLGAALFAPVLGGGERPVNHARFTFLDPAARSFWVDWERAADDLVATLRREAGRASGDRELAGLAAGLAARSQEFRTRWQAHDVRLHQTGTKHFRHPIAGEMRLDFEVLEMPADPGLTVIVFSAPAGSSDDDALRRLSGWASGRGRAEPDDGPGALVVERSEQTVR